MQLELIRWGDDTIRLAWWDFENGNDRVFVLGEDGQAFLAQVDALKSTYEELLFPANLVLLLRELVIEGRI